MGDNERTMEPSLVFRAGTYLCALPLQHVVEIMRPLAVESIAGAPSFVPGVSIIRGEALPVVDLAALLGIQNACTTRFITIRVTTRSVALAVDAVIGVRTLEDASIHELAPLLQKADVEVVTSMGESDGSLLLVLGSTNLIPESMWNQMNLVLTKEHVPS